MAQPLAVRKVHVDRFVREGAKTSHTKSARWVRRHGTRDVLVLLFRESSLGHIGAHGNGAYGIAGFRPCAWRESGVRKSANLHVQIEAFFRYVDARPQYRGSIPKALAHHRRRGWY